jgi:hypothetical protein
MKKVLIINSDEDQESMAQDFAEAIFDRARELVREHGVCYFRFTREDGMLIIHPKHNKQITGVIADA